jgi:hypothetical protein
MKKKFTNTHLADQYLESLNGMRQAEVDPFFYTRLKARMEKETADQGWSFPLKPAWLVSLLVIFLFINAFFLATQVKQNKAASSQETTLQNFASGYDLSISTSF